MDLQSVERRQTGLVQFLIIVIMLTLAAIMVLAYQVQTSRYIPMLALVALSACLYAAVQERKLRALHDATEQTLDTKVRVMDRMGDRLREESAKTQKLGTKLDELTKLYRAISAVNAVDDPEATYEVVVRAAIQLVNADTGSLMLLDRTGQQLYIRSATGRPEAAVASLRPRKLGEGVSGWVAENGQSVLLTGEAEDDDRFTNTISDTGIEVSLSVPLTHAHQVLGVLNLGVAEADGGDDSRSLGEADMSLANIFAQHAAVTVLRAQLLEERDG